VRLYNRDEQTDTEEKFAHENFSHPYGKQPSHGDEAQQQIEEENRAKVAAMSVEEREMETEELLARFGGGLVEVMRKRREQREKGANGFTSSSRNQAGPSKIAMSESGRIRQEVGGENERHLQAMSEDERTQEMQDLEGRFGAATLEALRRRAEQRAAKYGAPAPSAQRESATLAKY